MTHETPQVRGSIVAARKSGAVRTNAAAVRRERRIALVMVLTPLLGTLAALALLGWHPIGATELLLLAGTYSLSTAGVGIGYHRLASHRSFQTYTPIRVLLAVLGSTAGQGPLLYWAAVHRRHHKHSDEPEDPHSPHHHGGGLWGTLKGFWHVYLGWALVARPADWGYWVPDLLRDRALLRVNRLYFVWLFLGLAIPAAVGGWVHGTWMGALLGLLWGGLARMFLGQLNIAAVNTWTHLWGAQPYPTRDHSRNSALVALLSYGEGWHNNHHAFPNSAFHGLEWWQLDLNGLLVRVLQFLRLVWDVKCPSAAARAEARHAAGRMAANSPAETTAAQCSG